MTALYDKLFFLRDYDEYDKLYRSIHQLMEHSELSLIEILGVLRLVEELLLDEARTAED